MKAFTISQECGRRIEQFCHQIAPLMVQIIRQENKQKKVAALWYEVCDGLKPAPPTPELAARFAGQFTLDQYAKRFIASKG